MPDSVHPRYTHGNDGSQNGNDVLVNSGIQATLIAIQRELDDGATIEEIREIVAGLLYYSTGQKTQ